MRMMTFVRSLCLTALVAVTGCKSLDITNPNRRTPAARSPTRRPSRPSPAVRSGSG